MQKLLLKSLLFFIVICVLIKYTSSFIPPATAPSPDNYMAILNDKHRIADSIKTPKLILVGGSNLAFGIDSKILRKELSIPTANMGLHAGLGVGFLLNQAKYIAKENDIILLSIEHYLRPIEDRKLQKYSAKLCSYAKLFYEESFYLDFEEQLNDCKTIYVNYVNKQMSFLQTLLPKTLKTTSKPITPPKAIVQVSKVGIYSRQAINNDADLVAHLEEPLRDELASDGILNYRYWEGIALINDFAEEMKRKNVAVFFVFPNYPKEEYTVNKQVILLLEKDLRANLTVEILGNPTSFMYPSNYFYDTLYHLNKIGRKKRTEDLASLIKKTPAMMKTIERIKN